MKCRDLLSEELFEIDGDDVVAEIEQWVRDGIDADSGVTDYYVLTEDGEIYRGEVDPSDDA